MIALFAAAAEEIFFRGALLPVLARSLKSKETAVMGAGGIFALLHLLNLLAGYDLSLVLLQVGLALPVGILLGRLWFRRGLLSCVALHTLINLGPVPLYIDPGTGSMLFTILIGLLGVLRYLCRSWFIKLKFLFTSGKSSVQGDKLPLVIFADDRRYWQIFRPICEELAKRNFPVHYLTMSRDDSALEATYSGFTAEFIGSDNRAFAKLNFISCVLLLSTTPGLDVFQWKRSPEADYYIHIPHASTDITLYHMFGIDYYDAILFSGDYQLEQVRMLEKLRHLPTKELVKVGVPYMDVMKSKVARQETAGEGSTVRVLLAPSWGKSGLLSRFGGRIIEELLATGYQVIIRPHPQSYTSEKAMLEELQKQYPAGDRLEWNRDGDNFDVLSRSDILISDFSGVIFDFSLVFDRPVIYTNTGFDKGPYDAWWLEQEPWVLEKLPLLGEELQEGNLHELKGLIDACLKEDKYALGREQARRETWSYPGEGAVRTGDYLVAKYDALQEQAGQKVGS